jgi:hypothetical protein
MQFSSDDPAGFEFDNHLVEALDRNLEEKKTYNEEYFRECCQHALNGVLENQNQVFFDFCDIACRKIDDLDRENHKWFQIYEQNIELLDNFFNSRKFYLEKHYETLKLQLKELEDYDLSLDNEISSINSTLTTIESEKILITQKSKPTPNLIPILAYFCILISIIIILKY